jgi:hypothetical protein
MALKGIAEQAEGHGASVNVLGDYGSMSNIAAFSLI